MKNQGGRGRPGARAKTLVDDDELEVISSEAQYGDDAYNPMLRKLYIARSELRMCEILQKDKPLLAALVEKAQKLHSESIPWWNRLEFHGSMCRAIVDLDADFFREVARLLETRIEHPERRVDLEVTRAFSLLRARGPEVPTKKEVRETALFSLALANVLHRRGSRNAWLDAHDFSEEEVKLKPEVLKEVRQEMAQYPEQNWTRIFKRCGLANLRNDKGGKPTRRRKRAS